MLTAFIIAVAIITALVVRENIREHDNR
jgi:hypothetical protein